MKNHMPIALLILLTFPLALFAGPDVRPETKEITLEGGRHLVVTLVKTKSTAPWLVHMPGSGPHLNLLKKDYLEAITSHRKFNVLLINKVGISLDEKVDEDAFQRGSIRSQRILDNLFVMRELIPANAKILLSSHSEGAYISPEIAEKDPRVIGLILLSGNSWSWLEEEVRWLPIAEQKERRDFLENEVLPNPVFDKFYQDWSYAYFDSYCTDATYKTLLKTQIPTLFIFGSEDELLWIDGAIQNARQLIEVEGKANMRMHVFPANHALICPKSVPNCDQAVLSRDLKSSITNWLDSWF